MEPRRGWAAPPRAGERAVGSRVRGTVWSHGGVDRHLPRRQQPVARVVVRDHRADGLAEPLEQRLVSQEEEGAIPGDRAAAGSAELVAMEIGLLADVEVVA